VLQVLEHRQGAVDRLVRRAAVEAGDEADAAGVVLEARVVEAHGFHDPRLSPVL
jgi:hypothetical protein